MERYIGYTVHRRASIVVCGLSVLMALVSCGPAPKLQAQPHATASPHAGASPSEAPSPEVSSSPAVAPEAPANAVSVTANNPDVVLATSGDKSAPPTSGRVISATIVVPADAPHHSVNWQTNVELFIAGDGDIAEYAVSVSADGAQLFSARTSLHQENGTASPTASYHTLSLSGIATLGAGPHTFSVSVQVDEAYGHGVTQPGERGPHNGYPRSYGAQNRNLTLVDLGTSG